MRIDKDKAQQELEQLNRRHGGLSAEIVLDAARGLGSALHDYFEWADDVAAEKFRLEQARNLIRIFVIPVEVAGHPVITHRWQIPGDPLRDGTPNYRDVLDILSDEEMEYRLTVSAFERARDILARCPNKRAQRMAHKLSAEIMKLPLPKGRKAA